MQSIIDQSTSVVNATIARKAALDVHYHSGDLARICDERIAEFRDLCACISRADGLMTHHRPMSLDPVDLLAQNAQSALAIVKQVPDPVTLNHMLGDLSVGMRSDATITLSGVIITINALRGRLAEMAENFHEKQRDDKATGAALEAQVAVSMIGFWSQPRATAVLTADAVRGAMRPVIGWLKYESGKEAAEAIYQKETDSMSRIVLSSLEVRRVAEWKTTPMLTTMVHTVNASVDIVVHSTMPFSAGILELLRDTSGAALPHYMDGFLRAEHFACNYPGPAVRKWMRLYRDPDDRELALHMHHMSGDIMYTTPSRTSARESAFVSRDNCAHQEALLRRGYEVAVLRYLKEETARRVKEAPKRVADENAVPRKKVTFSEAP